MRGGKEEHKENLASRRIFYYNTNAGFGLILQ